MLNLELNQSVLTWTRDSVVPAVFGDKKYNGQKLALWERNYMMGHNKLIGGVLTFSLIYQSRGMYITLNC